jgi:hypothetical protein
MLFARTAARKHLHLGLDGRIHGRFLSPAGRPRFSASAAGGAPVFEGPVPAGDRLTGTHCPHDPHAATPGHWSAVVTPRAEVGYLITAETDERSDPLESHQPRLHDRSASMTAASAPTAVSTLILVVIGLAILGWVSSRPDTPGGGPAVVRALRLIVHFFTWILIIGGFSGGITFIAYGVSSVAVGDMYGVVVGALGLLLIGITVAFYVAVRPWLRF